MRFLLQLLTATAGDLGFADGATRESRRDPGSLYERAISSKLGHWLSKGAHVSCQTVDVDENFFSDDHRSRSRRGNENL